MRRRQDVTSRSLLIERWNEWIEKRGDTQDENECEDHESSRLRRRWNEWIRTHESVVRTVATSRVDKTPVEQARTVARTPGVNRSHAVETSPRADQTSPVAHEDDDGLIGAAIERACREADELGSFLMTYSPSSPPSASDDAV